MAYFNNTPSWTRYRSILSEQFDIRLPEDIPERYLIIRGHEIRLDDWVPEGRDPVGTIVLVHGAGGNGRVLAPFAQSACDAGWRVLAPDLPGYGLSKKNRSAQWTYDEWPETVAELARQQSGPVVLIGASMGGLTAVYAAQKVDGLSGVVATTLIDLSDPKTFVNAARWKALGQLSLVGMSLMPWMFDRMVMPLALTAPLKAMSANRDIQTYFQTDPYLGRLWVPVRFWRSVHEYRPGPASLNCPLLLVHPGADQWTPTDVSLETFEKIHADKSFVQLSNGSHLPIEHPAHSEMNNAVLRFLERTVQDRTD